MIESVRRQWEARERENGDERGEPISKAGKGGEVSINQ